LSQGGGGKNKLVGEEEGAKKRRERRGSRVLKNRGGEGGSIHRKNRRWKINGRRAVSRRGRQRKGRGSQGSNTIGVKGKENHQKCLNGIGPEGKHDAPPQRGYAPAARLGKIKVKGEGGRRGEPLWGGMREGDRSKESGTGGAQASHLLSQQCSLGIKKIQGGKTGKVW